MGLPSLAHCGDKLLRCLKEGNLSVVCLHRVRPPGRTAGAGANSDDRSTSAAEGGDLVVEMAQGKGGRRRSSREGI